VYLRVGEKGKKMLFKHIKPIESIETRGRKFIVDKHIKICKKCDKVWEKLNKRIHSTTYTIYPVGVIPRIGKGFKTCPRCKEGQTK
jgi:hypothetical protein